jgi:uncharacterized protein DUF955
MTSVSSRDSDNEYCSTLAYSRQLDRVSRSMRFTLTLKRAKRRAFQLIEAVGPIDNTRRRVTAYADLCRAEILERPLRGPGRLMPVPPDRWSIQVRADDRPGRRNYTACHELGHALFYEGGIFPPLGRGSQFMDDLIEERVCEAIASGLLMPRGMFLEAASHYRRPSWDAIEGLASTFDASLGATLLRVADTNPWPNVSVLRWRSVPHGANWLQLEAVSLRSDRTSEEISIEIDEATPLSVLRTYTQGMPTTDAFVNNSFLASRSIVLGGRRATISLLVQEA